MNDDLLAGRVRLHIHRQKHPRRGRGRGKPWAGPSETERRAALLLGHPPIKPGRPAKRR